jgi:hypothetical protein
MQQNQDKQIIKYEPNLINKQLKIQFPPRQSCDKCNKVHYYIIDKEICELTNIFTTMSFNK